MGPATDIVAPKTDRGGAGAKGPTTRPVGGVRGLGRWFKPAESRLACDADRPGGSTSAGKAGRASNAAANLLGVLEEVHRLRHSDGAARDARRDWRNPARSAVPSEVEESASCGSRPLGSARGDADASDFSTHSAPLRAGSLRSLEMTVLWYRVLGVARNDGIVEPLCFRQWCRTLNK